MVKVNQIGAYPQRVRPALASDRERLGARPGSSVSERVIQRAGRWKSGGYKAYTRNNGDDAGHVSQKLATSKGTKRKASQYTVWVKQQKSRITAGCGGIR